MTSAEFRMAWREIRPAFRKFVFMVAAIAIGVASVTGIKGFSEALDSAILRSARTLLAADIAVRFSSAPRGDEMAALDSLTRRGARLTRTTETVSMAAPKGAAQPVLCAVRAVDPLTFPFYGTLETEPVAPLASLLKDETLLASQEFLTRTGASVGVDVQIGNAQFRLVGILRSEPDRIAAGFDLGPRLMVTRGGLARSGLIQFGSRASEAFLFRLPDRGLTVEEARALLEPKITRPARILDYRNPNPSLSRGLERTSNFLSLVGLLALLVGGLGVATTVHTYLQQKLDTIAVLKCIGARSAQVTRIYLIQGLTPGILGSVIGVALGYGVQLLFPPLLKDFLSLPATLEPAPGAVLQGLVAGISITLLFLLPPLLGIRKVRPARVFLREMPGTRLSAFQSIRRDPLPMAVSLILAGGVGLIAGWLAGSLRQGFGFLLGLSGAVLILAAGARLLLVALRRIPAPPSLTIRHGLKNLNRPGNHVASIVVAIGLGVAFVLTIYLIQTSLLSQIVRSAPANFPNLFLIGITEKDRDSLWGLLKSQGGVIDAGRPIPAIPARIIRIDGKSPGELARSSDERHFHQIEFILTWAAEIPPDTRVVEGSWWAPPFGAPLVSVGQHAARELQLRPGSVLEFVSSGRTLRATVANIRESEFARPGSNNQFIFSPGSLDGLPASYVGALRVLPSETAALQRTLFSRFPNVSSIDVGQVLVRVQEVLDRIAAVIRFIGVFAILAGVIILASSVAATRHQRVREAVILKTLGATRSLVTRIHAAEFLTMGLAAGAVGSLLAVIAAKILLGRLLDTEFEMRWAPLAVATVSSAALAIVTGWAASRGVLSHKPFEVLREN
jgi:putative ABC transport system permease protein